MNETDPLLGDEDIHEEQETPSPPTFHWMDRKSWIVTCCLLIGILLFGGFIIFDRNETRIDLRLPKHTKPHSYSLYIDPDLKSLSFDGHVTIDFTCKKTSEIVLHASNLTIINMTLSSPTGVEPIKSWSLESAPFDFLRVQTVNALKGNYSLAIHYSGSMGDRNTNAFYRSQYSVDSVHVFVGVTHFEPIAARRAYPCFDEPALKATFNVSILAPRLYSALSNAPLSKVVPDKSRNLFVFERSVKMSSYLVAWAVHQYEFTTVLVRPGLELRIWTPLGRKEDGLFSLSIASKAILYYESVLNYPLPLSKMDLVPVPDFSAEAMENMGMITFDMNLLLTSPNNDLKKNQTTALLVAHELAHHWFGDLVTMSLWQDLWLNEGFAEYFQYRAIDSIYPEWQLDDLFFVQEHVLAFDGDASAYTHPIHFDLDGPKAPALFDDISYNKGASVLQMASHFTELLTDSKHLFFKGLSYYIEHYAFDVAGTHQLFKSIDHVLKDSLNLNISTLIDPFIQRPGFPLVSVTLDNVSIGFEQSRYTLSNITIDEAWPMLIEYHLMDLSLESPHAILKSHVLMTNASIKVALPRDLVVDLNDLLVVVNPGRFGFYRTRYDSHLIDKMWHGLTASKHAFLTPSDRSGFLSDQVALYLSNRSNEFWMNLADWTFLQYEESPAVWRTAVDLLTRLLFTFSLRSEQSDSLLTQSRTILKPVLERIHWFSSDTSRKHPLVAIRGTLLDFGFLIEEPTVISRGLDYFGDVSKGKWPKDLDPSFVTTVYCIGVRFGSALTFETQFEIVKMNSYPESTMPYDDWMVIIHGLSSTLVHEYQLLLLDFTLLSSRLLSQDREVVYQQISMTSHQGPGHFWSWIQLHWNVVLSHYGGSNEFGVLLTNSIGRIGDPILLDQIQSFSTLHTPNRPSPQADPREELLVTYISKGLERAATRPLK